MSEYGQKHVRNSDKKLSELGPNLCPHSDKANARLLAHVRIRTRPTRSSLRNPTRVWYIFQTARAFGLKIGHSLPDILELMSNSKAIIERSIYASICTLAGSPLLSAMVSRLTTLGFFSSSTCSSTDPSRFSSMWMREDSFSWSFLALARVMGPAGGKGKWWMRGFASHLPSLVVIQANYLSHNFIELLVLHVWTTCHTFILSDLSLIP